MSSSVPPSSIKSINEVNLPLEEVGFTRETVSEDNPASWANHIIIALPGIRTDGSWIDNLADDESIEIGKNRFKVYKVSDGYINVFQLVTWWNIWRVRYRFLSEINGIIANHPDERISIIAHSMGTAILSQIADDIRYKFEYIFLLGSICHQSKLNALKLRCRSLHIDRGSKDRWPIVAQAIRPDAYSHTGIYGADSHLGIIHRSFSNNHSNCTSLHHIRTQILPVLVGYKSEKSHFPVVYPALWKVNLVVWAMRSIPIWIFILWYFWPKISVLLGTLMEYLRFL
jgi:hypothetical protein